ncbi:MAG: winged helix-turn-helix transcriptional regulator [Clostridia bacterium]|nr:winged helix-turn-helix transcriptional regulator [Clostridia bacterium]
MDKNYDVLKIENQMCFPLYACSREIIKMYKPYLDLVDLTYTQYITMLILWEQGSATAKELGDRLYLDSGTLTPLLKKLESKKLVKRCRSKEDERSLIVTLTEEGVALREKAMEIPLGMSKCVKLTPEERTTLRALLDKLLESCT